MRTIHLLWCIMAVLVGALLAGCGGNELASPATQATARSAEATFTIQWPARSRYLPTAANVVEVVITDGTTEVARNHAWRPEGGGTSKVTFGLLPAGTFTATASAYEHIYQHETMRPNALAIGAGTLTTVSHQIAAVTLTMQTTIDHLVIAPEAVSMAVGAQRRITATAVNAAGDWLLQPPTTQLTWTYNTPGIVEVTAPDSWNSFLSAKAVGTVTVTATDTEVNKSGTATVTVRATAAVPGTLLIASGPYLQAHDADGSFKYQLYPPGTSSYYNIQLVACSGNGASLALTLSNGTLMVCNLLTGEWQSWTGRNFPSFSFDGTKIAYTRYDYYTGMNRIGVTDLTTGVETLLPAGDVPTISPDGELVTYTRQGMIYRVVVATQDETQLVTGAIPIFLPPNGDKIAYLDDNALKLLNESGVSSTVLTSPSPMGTLVASPDGQYLFYVTYNMAYRVKIDGTDLTQLTDNSGYISDMAFTPCTDFTASGMLRTTGTITVQ